MEDITRREFVETTAATLSGGALAAKLANADAADAGARYVRCSLTINGQRHDIDCDPRTTLLDLLRNRLRLTGTRKGCDHGQCGACTVLVNDVRVNSCLSLTVAQDGNNITTIEGLATAGGLHPLQAAFIERDGFQCGFCTAGQICSGVAMLKEWRAGMPSAVTRPAGKSTQPAELTDAEIRERMAGNICRCGAYPNIVAAIRDVQQEDSAGGHKA